MQTLLQRLDQCLKSDQVVLDDVDRLWTWGELRMRVLALAARLAALGAQRVALHADNGAAWLIVDLACQQANIPCVPLPLFFTGSQLQHAAHAAGIDVVFTQQPEQWQDAAPLQAAPTQDDCHDLGLWLLRRQPAQRPALPQGTGKLTFTSGSTGTPKGVCLSSAQQLLQAQALAQAVAVRAPRHLCVLPLSVLLENVAGVYAPLLAGGTVVLRPLQQLGFAGSSLQQPARLLQQLQQVQPDTLILIPQLLQVLVHAVQAGWQAPPFRFIAVGGARVAPALVHAARRSGLPVYEGYGLSECASVVSLNTPQADRAGSCGRPLPHVQLQQRGGELVVRGNLMLGYLDDASSWYPQEFATGDLGHIDDDGFVHIDGRRKHQLISSYGRNITPEWVESEVLGTLLFRDVVLVGEAKPWCSALLHPVAAAVSDEQIQQAIDGVNARLPDYARIQRWWRLPQPLAATPGLLTSNGRPRRAAIDAAFQHEIAALYTATTTDSLAPSAQRQPETFA